MQQALTAPARCPRGMPHMGYKPGRGVLARRNLSAEESEERGYGTDQTGYRDEIVDGDSVPIAPTATQDGRRPQLGRCEPSDLWIVNVITPRRAWDFVAFDCCRHGGSAVIGFRSRAWACTSE
ncbi:hypothetical protein KRM28CT15_53010 [Krasilnikovia sp. M28-CT-15]